LAAHAFLAVILGVLSVRTHNDILLYLLAAPVLIAPLVYPRAVALAMLFMTLAGSGIVVQLLRDNPINSVRTIVVLAPGLLAVVEILYRVKGQRDRIDAALREGDRRFRALIEKADGDYEAAVKSLAEPADRVLLVGDSLKDDIEPGIRAGMHAVLIDRKGRHACAAVVPTIRNLREVLSLV